MGTIKYLSYAFLINAFSCLLCNAEKADYRDGVFIVNEDWYGHQNSTVNWISDKGEWSYRVFQSANIENNSQLGCTNQFGQIYGNRFFLIAKQEKDPGASITGGRITVADARTMEMLYQSQIIDPSGNQCDGRAYLGVDEHKGYISTSNGIWIFDTDSYKVTGQVDGSANPNGADGKPNTDHTGSLYHGQCGTMVRVNDRVFAAHQQFGLLVIDPFCDKVIEIVTMDPVFNLLPEPGEGKNKIMPGIGSVILAKDGSLWVSVAKDTQGTGAALPYLMRVDPTTLECEVIKVPEGFYPPSNSWYAWTPDPFCASYQRNAIYWNGGPNSWFSNARVYRYDIDSQEFSIVINLDKEANDQQLDKYTRWNIYGCSMRVHPITDEIYMSLYHYFQNPTYKLRKTDYLGNIISEYDMIQNYWFPSLPVFPDNLPPVAHDDLTFIAGLRGIYTFPLSGLFTDGDSMESGIVKSIESISGNADFKAEIVNGDLEISTDSADENSNGVIIIKGNSNGQTALARVNIRFSTSGVGQIVLENDDEKYLTLSGIPLPSRPVSPGIYIMRKGNNTRKIYIK